MTKRCDDSHERDERAILPIWFSSDSEPSILFCGYSLEGLTEDGGATLFGKLAVAEEAFIARLTELEIAANHRRS